MPDGEEPTDEIEKLEAALAAGGDDGSVLLQLEGGEQLDSHVVEVLVHLSFHPDQRVPERSLLDLAAFRAAQEMGLEPLHVIGYQVHAAGVDVVVRVKSSR